MPHMKNLHPRNNQTQNLTQAISLHKIHYTKTNLPAIMAQTIKILNRSPIINENNNSSNLTVTIHFELDKVSHPLVDDPESPEDADLPERDIDMTRKIDSPSKAVGAFYGDAGLYKKCLQEFETYIACRDCGATQGSIYIRKDSDLDYWRKPYKQCDYCNNYYWLEKKDSKYSSASTLDETKSEEPENKMSIIKKIQKDLLLKKEIKNDVLSGEDFVEVINFLKNELDEMTPKFEDKNTLLQQAETLSESLDRHYIETEQMNWSGDDETNAIDILSKFYTCMKKFETEKKELQICKFANYIIFHTLFYYEDIKN